MCVNHLPNDKVLFETPYITLSYGGLTLVMTFRDGENDPEVDSIL